MPVSDNDSKHRDVGFDVWRREDKERVDQSLLIY